jgi:hypothetical protein
LIILILQEKGTRTFSPKTSVCLSSDIVCLLLFCLKLPFFLENFDAPFSKSRRPK